MIGIERNWLLLPVLALAVTLAAPVSAQTTASTERTPKPATKRAAPSSQSNGHVYLLRGLLNIFSLGMDDLAAKVQARGISASVHNHSEWQSLAEGIATKYKARQHGPIVLVGHSLGADAVMFMAEYLGKKGVPVALVVPFDGTGSFAASSNVSQVYNLTQRDYAYMRKGAGFRGTLNNVDVSGQGYGHIDIDKSAKLHALVLGKIQTVIRSRGVPQTADDAAPAPRQRAAAPSAEAAPAAPQATTAAKPAADAAPAAAPASNPAPATTASTNASASASVSVERTPAAAPAVSRPATSDASAKRKPVNSESGAKPALRF
ncbi:MAG: thioesterase domain-containing protein [Pseudorhodoplanes sp.]